MTRPTFAENCIETNGKLIKIEGTNSNIGTIELLPFISIELENSLIFFEKNNLELFGTIQSNWIENEVRQHACNGSSARGARALSIPTAPG